MTPRLFDCFTFFDELDVLDIRLDEIGLVVDRFVLVEATRTFQGDPKPLVFEQNRARFAAWADKIAHVVVEFPEPMSRVSSKARTRGTKERASAWDREYYQRNAIMHGLADARPDDIIMVSDVDEIPRQEVLRYILASGLYQDVILNLHMPYYRFFLNCMVTPPVKAHPPAPDGLLAKGRSAQTMEYGGQPTREQWNGPHLVERRYLTGANNLRRARRDAGKWFTRLGLRDLGARVKNARVCGMGNPVVGIDNAGWHFSSVGGYEGWLKKVAAFSHTEYRATPEVTDRGCFERWVADHHVVPIRDLPDCVRRDPQRWAHLFAPQVEALAAQTLAAE